MEPQGELPLSQGMEIQEVIPKTEIEAQIDDSKKEKPEAQIEVKSEAQIEVVKNSRK